MYRISKEETGKKGQDQDRKGKIKIERTFKTGIRLTNNTKIKKDMKIEESTMIEAGCKHKSAKTQEFKPDKAKHIKATF